MFPRLSARATFVADTKNVSDFVQKHFVSATNVSQIAQPKKHHGQQCVLVHQGLKTFLFNEVPVAVVVVVFLNSLNTEEKLPCNPHPVISSCSLSCMLKCMNYTGKYLAGATIL